MGVKNFKGSEILTLLASCQVIKLQFCAGIRHETPGSEIKEFISHSNST